jgi:hypothetical protein
MPPLPAVSLYVSNLHSIMQSGFGKFYLNILVHDEENNQTPRRAGQGVFTTGGSPMSDLFHLPVSRL